MLKKRPERIKRVFVSGVDIGPRPVYTPKGEVFIYREGKNVVVMLKTIVGGRKVVLPFSSQGHRRRG